MQSRPAPSNPTPFLPAFPVQSRQQAPQAAAARAIGWGKLPFREAAEGWSQQPQPEKEDTHPQGQAEDPLHVRPWKTLWAEVGGL